MAVLPSHTQVTCGYCFTVEASSCYIVFIWNNICINNASQYTENSHSNVILMSCYISLYTPNLTLRQFEISKQNSLKRFRHYCINLMDYLLWCVLLLWFFLQFGLYLIFQNLCSLMRAIQGQYHWQNMQLHVHS